MILKRLRQATTKNHAALESQLPLLDPQLNREHYQLFVRRFYGYYAPMEARLLALPWWAELSLDYGERYKTPRLRQDLLALGDTSESLAQLPHCQDLPELGTLSQLLGCLYVIEGSTLGGQIITRQLHSNLGLTLDTGCAFFNGYGEQTAARWKAFCTLLTAFAEQSSGDEEIINTANQTFETLERWLFAKSPTPITEL